MGRPCLVSSKAFNLLLSRACAESRGPCWAALLSAGLEPSGLLRRTFPAGGPAPGALALDPATPLWKVLAPWKTSTNLTFPLPVLLTRLTSWPQRTRRSDQGFGLVVFALFIFTKAVTCYSVEVDGPDNSLLWKLSWALQDV